MTRQRTILWVGLLIYAASFFLIAVRWPAPSISPLRGFICASYSLYFPFREATLGLQGGPFEDKAFAYFSLWVSGSINLIFLTTAVLISISRARHQRAVTILRGVLLLMIPFCWFFFHYQHLYPREGHFLWIIGMLLALFSNELATSHRVDTLALGASKSL